jgi:hypothetical protein
MSKLSARLKGVSIIVILYGLFVAVSLTLQCLVPFLRVLTERLGYSAWWVSLVNGNFILPMDIICDFWAAICAAYIGVDRGVMAISTYKGVKGKQDVGHPEHLRQVIVESFLVYAVAVLLYVLFDTDLQLAPLAVAFGSSVILYVGGQRAVYAASKLAPEEDLDRDGVRDSEQYTADEVAKLRETLAAANDKISTSCCTAFEDLTTQQRTQILRVAEAMKSGRPLTVRLNMKGDTKQQ